MAERVVNGIAPVAAPGLKSGGGGGGGQEGGQRLIMGGQTCARSASQFFLGKHVRGAHIASA